MIGMVGAAFIGRYGDRTRASKGYTLRKHAFGAYRLTLPPGPRAFVFAHALTPHRTTTVVEIDEITRDIVTYNLVSATYPGSDLVVHVYRDTEKEDEIVNKTEEIIAMAAIKGDGSNPVGPIERSGFATYKLRLPPGSAEARIHVQPKATSFRDVALKAFTANPDEREISVFTSRHARLPVETDIELLVTRNLGPLRGR